MTRTVAIVQARADSTRFPGKVLEPILGSPMLLRQLERVARARTLDRIAVATTSRGVDDPVAEMTADAGFVVVRGSTDDVLDRYRLAAEQTGADVVVRLTGDCPLIDPALVDEAVQAWRDHEEADFVSNALSGTYPDGMDTEVFPRPLLERACREARLPSEREHVTFYFWKSGRFRVQSLVAPEPLGRLRLTVDYPEDLAWVRRIYEELFPRNPGFSLADIVRVLPSLGEPPNAGIERNLGWQAALARDEAATDQP
jgi:spore coat polysaccharide biosynthesis protein SpsF